ncbi:MAG: hypothetical protein WC864_01230 [Ilumatobacteraceae bacterium]
MKTSSKLGIYALGVVGAFSLAATAGAAIGPIEVGSTASHSSMLIAAGEASALSGLSMVADGFQFTTDRTSVEANMPSTLTFRIERLDGSIVTDFDVLNERQLHLIVLSRNLVDYLHLHPSMDADGTWEVEIPSLKPNSYRLYADFQPSGAGRITLASDLAVMGLVELVATPDPIASFAIDGYTVSIIGEPVIGESALMFDVALAGQLVATDPYLGASGHLVIIRLGDLGYLHAHSIPQSDRSIHFVADFPTSGTYRLFLDFAHAGKVRTASFTVEIAPT